MDRVTRHTKIIFTIGPATDDEAMLESLIVEGADVCRINMAHASPEWAQDTLRRVRAVCGRIGRHIATMMDVKGPEIRTGNLEHPIDFKEGDLLDLVIDPETYESCNVKSVSINYPDLIKDVKIGEKILVDSGLIQLRIQGIATTHIRCVFLNDCLLGSRRHINLPGIRVNLPSLTDKDRRDLEVAVEEEVEFVALSFVREVADIERLRDFLKEKGSKAKIIAKVEDQVGLKNINAIIDVADGLMVARGDLGIEVPYEQLPIIQRQAIAECQKRGRPVIVATHLLESMIENPLPTRAEVTDIATAVMAQADCIMLSGETTVGKYPLECVETMNRIIFNAQQHAELEHNETLDLKTAKAKILRSAVVLAKELDDAAVIVFTQSGFLAWVLAALRPKGCPIYAFTEDSVVFKQMLILWGVEPFLMDFSDNPESTIQTAMQVLKKTGWSKSGDYLVAITNVLAGDKIVDSLQIRRIDKAVERH